MWYLEVSESAAIFVMIHCQLGHHVWPDPKEELDREKSVVLRNCSLCFRVCICFMRYRYQRK